MFKVKFGAAEVPLATRATFRIVCIELGAKERVASLAHFAPRLQKILHSAKRLLSLEVLAGMAAQMWRTAVLTQAHCGCEIRGVAHSQLRPLCAEGKPGISSKVPLELSNHCAAEAVCAHRLVPVLCARRQPPPPPPKPALDRFAEFIASFKFTGQRPAPEIFSCMERMEVRLFLDQWKTHSRPPTLEKVKAHDEGGCKKGNLEALGNEQIDVLAEQATDG